MAEEILTVEEFIERVDYEGLGCTVEDVYSPEALATLPDEELRQLALEAQGALEALRRLAMDVWRAMAALRARVEELSGPPRVDEESGATAVVFSADVPE